MVRAVPLAGLLVVIASAALFGLCNVIVKAVGGGAECTSPIVKFPTEDCNEFS